MKPRKSCKPHHHVVWCFLNVLFSSVVAKLTGHLMKLVEFFQPRTSLVIARWLDQTMCESNKHTILHQNRTKKKHVNFLNWEKKNNIHKRKSFRGWSGSNTKCNNDKKRGGNCYERILPLWGLFPPHIKVFIFIKFSSFFVSSFFLQPSLLLT